MIEDNRGQQKKEQETLEDNSKTIEDIRIRQKTIARPKKGN